MAGHFFHKITTIKTDTGYVHTLATKIYALAVGPPSKAMPASPANSNQGSRRIAQTTTSPVARSLKKVGQSSLPVVTRPIINPESARLAGACDSADKSVLLRPPWLSQCGFQRHGRDSRGIRLLSLRWRTRDHGHAQRAMGTGLLDRFIWTTTGGASSAVALENKVRTTRDPNAPTRKEH
jgi:hypothetical protein